MKTARLKANGFRGGWLVVVGACVFAVLPGRVLTPRLLGDAGPSGAVEVWSLEELNRLGAGFEFDSVEGGLTGLSELSDPEVKPPEADGLVRIREDWGGA